jgi:SAM-dependent methyltransferase
LYQQPQRGQCSATKQDSRGNTVMQNEPIALAAYETLAERYSARGENKAENGYIEHPAMRRAIGDVRGLDVLEAGCGPGFLARHLLAAGARVTGFDISPTMVALAERRTEGQAHLFQADLGQSLTRLGNESFDLVASSLVIDYVRDWRLPLAEFHRVLRPEGRLVFSVQHPLGSYLWYKPPTAFGVHYVEATWRGFGGEPVVVPDWYRSFAEIVNPLLAAGFVLRNIVETTPDPALESVDPERFAKYSRQPSFMILSAVKG